MQGTGCSELGECGVYSGVRVFHPSKALILGDAMFARFLAGGLAAALLIIPFSELHAQNSGLSPAEAPPASFQGSRFVDSRGCVFQRSTFGGQVSWVPLFGADAKPVCDGGATAAPAPREAAVTPRPPARPAPEPAPVTVATPEPAPPVVAAPAPVSPAPAPVAGSVEVVQPVITPQLETRPAAPVRRAAAPTPRRAAPPAQPTTPARHRACPEAAPYGQLVQASDGRRLVRCVSEPERLLAVTGRAVPLDPDAPAAPAAEVAEAAPVAAPVRTTAPAAQPATATTAQPAQATGAAISETAGRFVQVATFAVPANATRTRSALGAQAIPVRSMRSQLRGQPVEVILAGPFRTDADLRRALGAVRALGFRDAFVRS